jgi:Tol biopolymer transport system component
MRGRPLVVAVTVGMLCDGLSSQDEPRWLTAPQTDSRRSAVSAASASISGDGRYVAFTSYARLTSADADLMADIYVLDRSTATVTLESAVADGRPLNSDCSHPRITADGRYVAFEAIPTNGPQRSETGADRSEMGVDRSGMAVVLRDRVENTARWISLGPGGVLPNGWSGQPDIAANGSTIVFVSAATDLVADDLNGSHADIYRLDLASNRIERISVNSRGVQQQGASQSPSVSGDGRYVAFASMAALGPSREGAEQTPNPQRYPTIYLRDTRTGRTTPIVGRSGPPDDSSTMPVVSADGRFVAFASRATNLTPRDRNKSSDVFLYEIETGALTLVSRAAGGGPANGSSLTPAISADGRFVAFQSDASDMACARDCRPASEDINLLPDVFIFDRLSGQISPVSLGRHGPWMEESAAPAIDANGTVVAFTSRHPISPLDVLNDFDLFVRGLDP